MGAHWAIAPRSVREQHPPRSDTAEDPLYRRTGGSLEKPRQRTDLGCNQQRSGLAEHSRPRDEPARFSPALCRHERERSLPLDRRRCNLDSDPSQSRTSRSRPKLSKVERILSVFRLNLILLVSSLRLPRTTMLVSVTVGQHLVRQGLPLLDRHEFLHSETKRKNLCGRLHPQTVCFIQNLRKFLRGRCVVCIQFIEPAMRRPILLTAGFQFCDNIVHNRFDLLSLLLILDGPINQRGHVLLPLLPIGIT